jgi:hypothetical protein
LRHRFTVVAKNGIENVLWILAPSVEQVCADGRADGVAQRTLSINDGYCLGNVPRSDPTPIDAVLKSIGGFAHIVQACKHRQPRNMSIVQFKPGSRA